MARKKAGTFNCPKCGTRCSYSQKPDNKANLKHPLPTCGVEARDLMLAYLHTAKPQPSYDWKEVTESIFRKEGSGL